MSISFFWSESFCAVFQFKINFSLWMGSYVTFLIYLRNFEFTCLLLIQALLSFNYVSVSLGVLGNSALTLRGCDATERMKAGSSVYQM